MRVLKSIRHTARNVAVTLAVTASIATPLAPDATAQQRNMVILGDSVVSDPAVPQWAAGKVGIGPNGSSDFHVWCPTSPSNYGKRAAAKLGMPARDYSCTGTVTIHQGPPFSSQIDRALRDGGLSAATQRVIVATGFNDTYLSGRYNINDFRRDWSNAMVPQINRIRAAAPNARIQIVGYPKITENGNVCLFHIAPNVSDTTPFANVAYWEDSAQWAQVDLARKTGTEFVDLKPSTSNNSMCAPDHLRMWSGMVDFYGGPGHMPLHVNQRGHEHVANIIARS